MVEACIKQNVAVSKEETDIRTEIAKIIGNADIEDPTRGLDVWENIVSDLADQILTYARPIIEAEYLEKLRKEEKLPIMTLEEIGGGK